MTIEVLVFSKDKLKSSSRKKNQPPPCQQRKFYVVIHVLNPASFSMIKTSKQQTRPKLIRPIKAPFSALPNIVHEYLNLKNENECRKGDREVERF